jgi:xanthine dehydrogenase YagR molybdenum-binding subunit
MAKLVKTTVEVEGATEEELTLVEGEEPAHWTADSLLRAVGNRKTRIDGPQRVSGSATYTFDVQLPGMLYARVLRCPFASARIKRIDVSKAEKLAGVRAVLFYVNADAQPFDGIPVFEKTLRYFGDDVAALAADDEAIAEDALRLIEVEYEELPFVLDEVQALAHGAPEAHPDGNLAQGKARTYNRGDVRRGLAEADEVVEHEYRTQAVYHTCMETHGAVASWEGDQLTVWESTQSVNWAREDLAEYFGLSLNKVRVISEYMGGGFGSKQYTGKWTVLAALLAKRAGKPVRLMLPRSDETQTAGFRLSTVQKLKIGAKKDGTLTIIDLEIKGNQGSWGRWAPLVEGPAQVMYACPNVRTELRGAHTNLCAARSYRGPGYVEGAFALESAMDELAAKLGIDPLELRRKNYAKVDPAQGEKYSAKHLDECYDKGGQMSGWNTGVTSTDGKRRAMGMASQTWGGGGGPPAYAWVMLTHDGSVQVVTGSQDVGTGTRTVFAQIAAEELAVDPSKVRVQIGDTQAGPYDPVSWGSMTVSSVGPAVRQAAVDVKHQLLEVAADYLKVPVASLELARDGIHIKGEGAPQLTVASLSEQIGEFTIMGKGARGPNKPNLEVRTFGAQFADVEVDMHSGAVKIHNIVTVHDFGRVINPLGAKSQAEGATIQGIGYALTEQKVVDPATGIILNPNMEDHGVPTMMDFESIGHAFIDKPDNAANNLGAKGLGEPALIPTAPAIANALSRALGVKFLSLPLTREKILAGIAKAGSGEVIP